MAFLFSKAGYCYVVRAFGACVISMGGREEAGLCLRHSIRRKNGTTHTYWRLGRSGTAWWEGGKRNRCAIGELLPTGREAVSWTQTAAVLVSPDWQSQELSGIPCLSG
jgi:hypothetical protein